MNAMVTRMLTRRGFVELFWEELRRMREEDPGISRCKVFEHLNGIYYDEAGEFKYPSYNAFRHSKEFLQR